jgi:hypothetical protein
MFMAVGQDSFGQHQCPLRYYCHSALLSGLSPGHHRKDTNLIAIEELKRNVEEIQVF